MNADNPVLLKDRPEIAMHEITKNSTNPDICVSIKENELNRTKKWRKSVYLEPGTRVIHPALVEDFPHGHEQGIIFGAMATHSGHRVEEIFNGEEGDCQQVKRQQKEALYYKSSRMVPLGKSYNRGHNLPEFMKDDGFRFGVTTTKCQDDAKSLLYSDNTQKEDNGMTNYVKSHGSYSPGQQRSRDYNWPIDPETTVFGDKGESTAERGISKGVSNALCMPQDNSGAAVRASDKASRSCAFPRDMVFGKITKDCNSSAAQCLQPVSNKDHFKDDDLGKSVTPGFRNAMTEKVSFIFCLLCIIN